jgi:hypothetical protein
VIAAFCGALNVVLNIPAIVEITGCTPKITYFDVVIAELNFALSRSEQLLNISNNADHYRSGQPRPGMEFNPPLHSWAPTTKWRISGG